MRNLIAALSLILLVAFMGCSSEKKEQTAADSTKVANFSSQTVKHKFSDTTAEDTFEVRLTGETPETMEVLFTITSHTGEKIYDLTIKGTDLLGSTDPNVDLREQSAQIAFIKNIAADFLDEDKFLEPAVTQDQMADDYTPDKTFHEELKKTGLDGFRYRLGKENNYYIAWSVSEKKVKVYYNCC